MIMAQNEYEKIVKAMADKGVPHLFFELLADLRKNEIDNSKAIDGIEFAVATALNGYKDFENNDAHEGNYLQVIRKLTSDYKKALDEIDDYYNAWANYQVEKGANEMSKFNFKPFDKVLVRDDDGDTWKIEFFEREDKDVGSYPYVCMNCGYVECIPYNEETKHLLGTNKPYTTKEDEATKYTPGEIVETWISGDIWEEAIYLEFKERHYSEGGGHRIYDKKLGICTQPPNEIRKKG